MSEHGSEGGGVSDQQNSEIRCQSRVGREQGEEGDQMSEQGRGRRWGDQMSEQGSGEESSGEEG